MGPGAGEIGTSPKGPRQQLGSVVHAQVLGSPWVTTRRSMTSISLSAVIERSTSCQGLSRVLVDDVGDLESPPASAVSSNWKSMAQTWFGYSAR